MHILIYLFFILLNGCFAFKKKNENIIISFSIFYLIIFMLGNETAPDYLSYLNDYTEMLTKGVSSFNDIGYVFVEKFFVNLNLNYSVFRMAIIIGSLLFLYNGLKKYKINYHFILSIVMIYQCFMDTMQIRNFFAVSIFIYASQFILIPESKNKLKYIIFIILAGLFHSSLLIYIVFVFNDYLMKHKKILEKLFIVSLILFLFVFIFPDYMSNLFMIIFTSIGKEAIYTRYFSNLAQSLGFLLPVISYTFLILIISLYMRTNKCELKDVNIMQSILNLNNISMLFLPLVIIDPTWYRINRNLNMVNYICLWNIYEKQTNMKGKILFFGFSYLFALIWFYIECYNWIGLEKIISMLNINGFWL